MNKRQITFLFISLLSGCSGKPSDQNIERQVVESLLSEGGDAFFQVENFKKTNGFEKDSKTYIADVKYEIVFKKGIDEMAQQMRIDSQESLFGEFGAGVIIMALKLQYGDFDAGQRVLEEEKYTFINSENGWMLSERE